MPGRSTSAERWHQALAYAVSGRLVDGLGRQQAPDVGGLLQALPGGFAAEVAAVREQARQRRQPWPVAVPDELMGLLGRAQFHAALSELVEQLRLDRPTRLPVDRQLTASERRLVEDRPPHHGC